MNLQGLGVAFAIGAVGVGLVVAAIALFGCRAAVPAEPPFTMTVAASARDQ